LTFLFLAASFLAADERVCTGAAQRYMGIQRHQQSRSVILVAEDDDEDFYLLRTTLAKLRRHILLCQVRDGRQALRYLEGTGAYSDRQRFPYPDLLILDLKMPVLDGIDLLAALRQSPSLDDLPVVVLSGANLPDAQSISHALGAQAYYVKSGSSAQRLKDLRQICRKWLQRKNGERKPDPAAAD